MTRRAPTRLLGWLAVGAIGFLLVPVVRAAGHACSALGWLPQFATQGQRAGAAAGLSARPRLACAARPLLAAGVAAAAATLARRARATRWSPSARPASSICFVQGFAIGPRGWSFESLAAALPASPRGQFGMGLGAALVAHVVRDAVRARARRARLLQGRRVRRRQRRRRSRCWSALFTFFPVADDPDLRRCRTATARSSLSAFARRGSFTEKIWGLGCIAGSTRCGVAWNTLLARVRSARPAARRSASRSR